MEIQTKLLFELRDRAARMNKRMNRDVRELKQSEYNWIDLSNFLWEAGGLADIIRNERENIEEMWDVGGAGVAKQIADRYTELDRFLRSASRIVAEWTEILPQKYTNQAWKAFTEQILDINNYNRDMASSIGIPQLITIANDFDKYAEDYADKPPEKIYQQTDIDDFLGNAEVTVTGLKQLHDGFAEALYYFYHTRDVWTLKGIVNEYSYVERYYESAMRFEASVANIVPNQERRVFREEVRDTIRAIDKMIMDTVYKVSKYRGGREVMR